MSSQSQAGVSWWAHKFHFFPYCSAPCCCRELYPGLSSAPRLCREANTCPQMTPQWLKLMKTLLTSCARSFQCPLCHERYMTHISHLLRLLSRSTYTIFNFKVLRSFGKPSHSPLCWVYAACFLLHVLNIRGKLQTASFSQQSLNTFYTLIKSWQLSVWFCNMLLG